MANTALSKMNEKLRNIGSAEKNVGQVERVVSAALGSWMLLSAFGKRKNLAGRSTRLGLGGYLLYRGISGNCALYSAMGIKNEQPKAMELRTALMVNKPKDEVFRFWRKLENLPRFMDHLNLVEEIDNRRSHWKANIPGNLGTVEWEAQITDEKPGELIAWESVEDSTLYNSGQVSFRDAQNGRGTEILVRIIYQPPAGNAGKAVAKLFNPMFEKMVRADINRFKQFMESGENMTSGNVNKTGASAQQSVRK